MNLSRLWLVFLAAGFPLTAAAAPAPVPAPAAGGLIAEVLRLRDLLPANASVSVQPAVAAKEGVIQLEHPVLEAVEVTRTGLRPVLQERAVDETVTLPDGKV